MQSSLAPVRLAHLVGFMRRVLAVIIALTSALGAYPAPGPYDETADSGSEIKAALIAAKGSKTQVLVVFGANWCSDCKALDTSFKSGTTAPLIEKFFKVVKVNVGRVDHNVAIAETYGVPLKQGIPAIAVLNSDGKVVFATRSGELANAKKIGDKGLGDFFAKLVGQAQ